MSCGFDNAGAGDQRPYTICKIDGSLTLAVLIGGATRRK